MNTYRRDRFPSDIISYAVWLYYRFNLSHRGIEDLLAERGVNVTYEAIPSAMRSSNCCVLGLGQLKVSGATLLRFQD